MPCRAMPASTAVEPGSAQVLDVFFPIAPSPVEVRIDYEDASGERSIVMDTSGALEGLHLAPGAD